MQIQKKIIGGGVRGDENEELKFLVFVKIQKKKIFFWWGVGGRGQWGGRWGGSGWGVRVDVKEELKFL